MALIPKSDLLSAAYDTAIGMHKAKIISDEEFADYEKACMVHAVPEFDGAKIKALRQKNGINQKTLALCMNVSVSAVRQWEQNQKRPGNACCKLLDLIERHGIDYIS